RGIPRILTKKLLKELIINKYKDFFEKHQNKFNIQFKNLKERFEKEKIKTASSFTFEWLNYPRVIKEFEKDWKRFFYPYIKPNNIKNKIVVDIGCGMAKHGFFTAKYGAKYIGIDLSEAVEAAYHNTKRFRSLIIQADVYNLPLKGPLIDYYYSIGVIHHLPTPKEGFLKIINLMKKDSKILIWVYSTYKNKRAFYIYNPLRKITTKLSKKKLYYLCHIPAILTHVFNYISRIFEKFHLKSIAKRIPFYYYNTFPYRFKHNDSFDILASPIQKYFSKDEVEEWFKDGNLQTYKLVYDVFQGIKGYGTK
ncbi:MAG: class I SAM-dependent methyltransferase, partial [Promethearchaeota archaeon]